MQTISNLKTRRNIIGIILTGILIIFFYSKSYIDKDKLYKNLNTLIQLKEQNNSVDTNFYLVKFDKVKHYDFLRDSYEKLKYSSNSLKDSKDFIESKSYKYNLSKLYDNLTFKEEKLNRFISNFAVYKNLENHLFKLLLETTNKIKNDNRDLSIEILKIERSVKDEDFNTKKLLENISLKKVNLEKSNQELIDYLVNYVNLYLKARNEIKNFELEFLKIDLNENINLLITNFKIYATELEKKSDKYDILNMILIFSLFAWISYFIKNLNIANKQVQDAIRELNFQKSALDEHAIVSITDEKGNITYVNDKFLNISGYKEEELLGKNHRILKSNEHDSEFFEKLWKTIKAGKTWRGEVKNRKKDGTYYWVFATVVPFLDIFGKPFKYISIRTDITNRKEIELELLEAKHIADESNKIKGEFLANMSHELRTPLNGVIGMAHIALENEKDKKQKLYLEKINISANILLKIINDLLDYSKIEAGKLPIEVIEFKIDYLLQSVADLVSVKAYDKELELHFNRDMKIPYILYGDSLRVGQILVNIIGNSIKFTEKGEVALDLHLDYMNDEEVMLRFDVRDTGIGMDEKTISNIFNSFTQADSSITRIYGGTGLGLTITKNLIELMNGKIEVESEVGIGTTFKVYLPFRYKIEEKIVDFSLTKESVIYIYNVCDAILVSLSEILFSLKIQFKVIQNLEVDFKEKDIVITENRYCLEANNKQSTILLINPNITINNYNDNIKIITKPINPSVIYDSILDLLNVDEKYLSYLLLDKSEEKIYEAKVLIVEDNEINQLVASTFFDNIGCKYEIANNGKEAVDMLRVSPKGFDIVFMDIQMPIMNGYESTIAIREELKLDLPIIAMTANAMKEDIEKAESCGMNSHISKPIDPNEIEKAIKKFVVNLKKNK